MNRSPTRRLRYLLALGVLGLIPLLLVVSWALGEITAIKGSYALLSLLIALVVLRVPVERNTEAVTPGREFGFSNSFTRCATKGVLLLVLGAYLTVYLGYSRLVSMGCVLVVGIALVVYQLFTVQDFRALTAQIGLLFTVGPVTRYLSTGFYFGTGVDLISHVQAVRLFLQSGRIASIDTVYATYSSFPALHVVSASVSAFSGLPAYDSLILLGTLVFLMVTVAVISLVGVLRSPLEGVTVGFVFAFLSTVQSYTSYFYPQALATAFIVFLLFIVVKRKSLDQTRRSSVAFTAIVSILSLSVSHHVTQILLTGIVVGLLVPSLLTKTKRGRRLRINENEPHVLPLQLAIISGLTYLVLTRINIVAYFLQFVSKKSTNPFVSDTGGDLGLFAFGTTIPYQGIEAAVLSLFYVDGIYYTSLTVLFVLGTLTVLARYERYAPIAGYLFLGVLGSLFVLRTPLLSLSSRLALPLSLFFSFVAGIGISQVVRSVRAPVPENGAKREHVRRVLAAGVVVVAATTGPLVAADDLYGLHRGPNLWETYTAPEPQVEFSEQELAEIEATVSYVDRHTEEATMLWITREMSDFFNGEERSVADISTRGIRTDGVLVYRTAWTEHQVGGGSPLSTILMADWWLEREIGAANKIYTTGQVGVAHEQNGTYFAAPEK